MQSHKTKMLPFPRPAFNTIGHRGAGHLAPENSLASFKRAREIGLTWVEFDTQPCASGEWVVFHDESLERCTKGRGLVADCPWETLKTLTILEPNHPEWPQEPIPLLEQALKTILSLNLHPNIEIKGPLKTPKKSLAQFLSILEKVWPKAAPQSKQSPPLISSFDPSILFELKKMAPHLPLGYNIEEWKDEDLNILQRGNFFSLHCDYQHLSNEQRKYLLSLPYPILLYTVNNPAEAVKYFKEGIWAVFSDAPNLIAQTSIKD